MLEEAEQALGEERAEADAADTARHAQRSRQRRTNQGALPNHLPRVAVVIGPVTKQRSCCGGALHASGENVSKRLDPIPAQFRVFFTRPPKYTCSRCAEGVVKAAAPER